MPEKTVPSSPLRFVFVGAFRDSANDGSVGGQLFACRTLLSSPLSDYVDWLPLDSTMETLPPPPLTRRFLLAGKRLIAFLYMIHQPSVHGALIFSSAGYSMLEKGLMVLLSHIVGKRTILSPRSGLMVDDLKRSGLMRRFVPLVLRNSDVILCQSQSWKQLYKAISGLPDHRFSVVPNWLDTRDLVNLAPRSVEGDSINVLFLGWIERYKGIYDLVEAVSYCRDEFKNSRIVVCGRGSELASVKREVAERRLSPPFDFRSWVTGMEKLTVLQQADVFVLPSHREGMPNALLEAMAPSATPQRVLTTTISACCWHWACPRPGI